MVQTAPGNRIPFPERMKEQFQRHDNRIEFVVSFEKLGDLMADFVKAQPEPLFLILQIPLSSAEEEAMGTKPGDSPHEELLYLNGCSQAQIRDIMNRYGPILLGDGISQFAIVSHTSRDEIFVQKYKVVTIFSADPHRYDPLMDKYGIAQTRKLRTPWDTFGGGHYGDCYCIDVDGMTVYDVANALKSQGLHRVKVVEAI